MQRYLFKIIIITGLFIIFLLGCRKKDSPPYNPYTPDGPTTGFIKKAYHFSSLANDPNGDGVTMRFDWGNGDTSEWASDWAFTGEAITMSYFWSYPDTYYIRCQAKDKSENTSSWSLPHCIIIETPQVIINEPPISFIPSGPSTGYVDCFYKFFGSAIDPEGYGVSIRFDWGDGDISDWSDEIPSGDSVFMTHAWLNPGAHYLKVQARDSLGLTSNWSVPHSIGIALIEWICATMSPEWSPRESHSSVVFDNKMWVMGGHDCPDEVWSSTDGVNWFCVTDSAGFGERDDAKAVVFDNKIWLIAGSHGNPMNDVWCSSDGASWTRVINHAPWSPRYDHAAVVFDNMIWVLGGIAANNRFNDVWFSADGIDWSCATDSAPWQPRQNLAAVAFDNKMWVMGGEIFGGGGSNDVWFTMDGANWSDAPVAGWRPRYWHTSVVFDNKIWVIGGSFLNSGMDDVWFTADGLEWFEEIPRRRFLPRADHTSVVFDNKIWVLGGQSGGNIFHDIWYRTVTYGK